MASRQVKDKDSKRETFSPTDTEFEFETRSDNHMIQLVGTGFGTAFSLQIFHSIDDGENYNEVPDAEIIEIEGNTHSIYIPNLKTDGLKLVYLDHTGGTPEYKVWYKGDFD